MRQKVEYKKEDVLGTCKFIKEVSPIVFEVTKTNKSKTIKRCATFQCDCGKEFDCMILAVKNGNTKSCGCLRDNKIQQQGFKNKDHGQRNHRLYKSWQGMLRRCNNPNDFGYYNYGGRGIEVCNRWKDINNFLLDMYSTYQEGLELDRINVNGNYEPENCKWVTRKQNMNNMRRNRIVEYNGIKKTVSEWSDELNIPYKRLLARLNNWDVEKSFTYQISYK
jgi:hypothetical protein